MYGLFEILIINYCGRFTVISIKAIMGNLNDQKLSAFFLALISPYLFPVLRTFFSPKYVFILQDKVHLK